ncbi:Zinc transporter ZIP11 [Trichinella pseudospiralis]|uniref:Zinc transporter ZIP11 n=1 Tax=Trichinella pseudospiralis TaxID=6337 RepID=A0A0V1IIV1_TRIPS|nr:Zinc transporter ZIP11 [Trichinella pseudospiralis]
MIIVGNFVFSISFQPYHETMLRSYGPVAQAMLGSLFTWGVTALGAAGVFFFKPDNRYVLGE